MTTFEATHVVVERQPDRQITDTHTESGGYKVYGRDLDGQEEEFDAFALNLNGFSFSADTLSIAEYQQTVLIEQETDGGYLNLVVEK
ncbi:hypothetical protein [Halapricum desulfuricans]|uniref:Uncharacterized protein n=1 Tax=Halapricum desulfuricans TaxID=2841257 RepID=A0A897N2D0_9EURY|nr:hypothetical protein [Halapricum desulfuricans]QSG06378.1 hypothetical protein HSR121_2046 [Halapricum desulfuricans]